jgi:hypothetical protein
VTICTNTTVPFATRATRAAIGWLVRRGKIHPVVQECVYTLFVVLSGPRGSCLSRSPPTLRKRHIRPQQSIGEQQIAFLHESRASLGQRVQSAAALSWYVAPVQQYYQVPSAVLHHYLASCGNLASPLSDPNIARSRSTPPQNRVRIILYVGISKTCPSQFGCMSVKHTTRCCIAIIMHHGLF